MKKEKLKVFKIGVFVNSSYDEVMNNVDNFGLDMVQLHGEERPYFCERLSNNISVVKAFRVSADENIKWKVKDFYNDSDLFLFDTDGGSYGGTGKKFDWKILSGVNIDKPFFLSGGIKPEDSQAIKDFNLLPVAKDLFAVDINSGFETSPGIKNLKKVQEFINNIKNEKDKPTG